MGNKFRRKHFTHFILTARVANHACAAAQKHNRAVPCLLHMAHCH